MPLKKNGHLRIAITGASSGIGRALALEFASPDTSLFLTARRENLLKEVAEKCRARKAEAHISVTDLADPLATEDWIAEIESHGPIDLFVLNAGVFSGSTCEEKLEDARTAKKVLSVNLVSPVVASLIMAQKMVDRRNGHIVFISSLAAKAPQADAPVYTGSKAGLTGFGKAMREYLLQHGVRVTIVHPGHVSTLQADLQQGPLPFMISPQKAAAKIVSAISAGRSEVNFPLLPRVLTLILGCLPWRLQALINKPLRFQVLQNEEVQSGKSTVEK